MMWHGAQAGAFELRAAVMEAMTAFRRAGGAQLPWPCFMISCTIVAVDYISGPQPFLYHYLMSDSIFTAQS